MSDLNSPFEFNHNNEMHQRAKHYLETMDRNVFPSFGDVMVTAIVDYFDRYYAEQTADVTDKADDMSGTPLDDLDIRIEQAVERALKKSLPALLTDALSNEDIIAAISADPGSDNDSEQKDKGDESVDLSNVAENISWGFLNG